MTRHLHRPSLVVILAAGLTVATTACTDVSTVSQARAEISGPDGTPVQVVTSRRFVREQASSSPTSPDTASTSVSLITADTTRRTLPATVTQSLTETQRFYIRVALTDSAAADADGPVNAQMQLLVDGEERGRVQNDLVESAIRIAFTSFVSG